MVKSVAPTISTHEFVLILKEGLEARLSVPVSEIYVESYNENAPIVSITQIGKDPEGALIQTRDVKHRARK